MTRGQFIRLFIGTTQQQVVAAAKQLTLHISTQFESATTKDDTGTWARQEPVSTSYDIQTSALIYDDNDTLNTGAQNLNNFEDYAATGGPLVWSINNVSGNNNRTKGSAIASGTCFCNNVTINAQSKQNAQYSASFTGTKEMTIGA